MGRAVAYVRVSTFDQSLASQQNDIRAYVQARGISLDHEYRDEGVSGMRSSRPGLDALLKDARRRRVKTVIVWSLSRLGRSLKHLISILEEFQACGVTLISLKEGWDLSTPMGRMIFQVVGSLSEYEREMIRERVKSGLRAARVRGKILGRPCHKYEPERIKALKMAGLSYRAIAKEVGVSIATISRVLQNPQIPAVINA